MRRKSLLKSGRSAILIELTMHIPVQPHDHRCSLSEIEVVRPTMLGESSQNSGKPQKIIGGA